MATKKKTTDEVPDDTNKVSTEAAQGIITELFKNSDKYTALKHDLQNVADQGLESYQESTDGRVIDYIGLRLLSKHGVFVKTGDNGTIEVLMSGLEIDPKTLEKNKQKLEIGLNVEVATKGVVSTSTNLMKRKNVMPKNFEVIS